MGLRPERMRGRIGREREAPGDTPKPEWSTVLLEVANGTEDGGSSDDLNAPPVPEEEGKEVRKGRRTKIGHSPEEKAGDAR